MLREQIAVCQLGSPWTSMKTITLEAPPTHSINKNYFLGSWLYQKSVFSTWTQCFPLPKNQSRSQNDDTSEFVLEIKFYIALDSPHTCLKDLFDFEALENQFNDKWMGTWTGCGNSVLNSRKNRGFVPRHSRWSQEIPTTHASYTGSRKDRFTTTFWSY